MKQNDITEKILAGTQLAIQRLIEQKRKEDSYIVVSENGKVVKLWARDIPPQNDKPKSES